MESKLEIDKVNQYFEDVVHWKYALDESLKVRMNWICPKCGKKYSEHKRPDMPNQVYYYYLQQEYKAWKRQEEENEKIKRMEMEKLQKREHIENAVDEYQRKKSKHIKV